MKKKSPAYHLKHYSADELVALGRCPKDGYRFSDTGQRYGQSNNVFQEACPHCGLTILVSMDAHENRYLAETINMVISDYDKLVDAWLEKYAEEVSRTNAPKCPRCDHPYVFFGFCGTATYICGCGMPSVDEVLRGRP